MKNNLFLGFLIMFLLVISITYGQQPPVFELYYGYINLECNLTGNVLYIKAVSNTTDTLNLTFIGYNGKYYIYKYGGAAAGEDKLSASGNEGDEVRFYLGVYNFREIYIGNDSIDAYAVTAKNFTVELNNCVNLDNIKPIIKIYSPENKTYNTKEIYINYTVYDNIGLKKVWYELNGISEETNVTYTKRITLDTGSYCLKVYANDLNENLNENEVCFTIKVAAPAPPAPAPAPAPGVGVTYEVITEEFTELTDQIFEKVLIAKGYDTKHYIAIPKEALASILSMAHVTFKYPYFEGLKGIIKRKPENVTGDIYNITCKIAMEKYTWVPEIILARGDLIVDSYAAITLARKLNVPILLTYPNKLPSVTIETIKKLKPRKVIIIGGPKAISEEIEIELKKYVKEVERIWGETRIETSVEIAKLIKPVDYVIISNWNSSEKAAYLGYIYKAPIIYVKGTKLPAAVKSYLEEILKKYPRPKVIFIDVSKEIINEVKKLTE